MSMPALPAVDDDDGLRAVEMLVLTRAAVE
jgi:hypothetical protein